MPNETSVDASVKAPVPPGGGRGAAGSDADPAPALAPDPAPASASAPAPAPAPAPDALAARYERDGYLAPFRVLAPEEAGGCWQRMQALRKERPEDAAIPNPALDPLPRRGEGAAEGVVA